MDSAREHGQNQPLGRTTSKGAGQTEPIPLVDKTAKSEAGKTGKHNPDLLFRPIALACLASNVLDRAFRGPLVPFRLLSHRSLLNGDDGPKNLPYANPLICSISADAGHKKFVRPQLNHSVGVGQLLIPINKANISSNISGLGAMMKLNLPSPENLHG